MNRKPTHKKNGLKLKIVNIKQNEFNTMLECVRINGTDVFDIFTIEIPSFKYEQWKIDLT